MPRSKWIMRLALLGILAPFGGERRPAGSSPRWAASPSWSRPTRPPAASTGCSCSPRPRSRPGVTGGELLFSLISLTAVYVVLLVVEVALLVKYVRGGVVSAMPELGRPRRPEDGPGDGDRTTATATCSRSPTDPTRLRAEGTVMDILPTVWFIAIAVLWIGYLLLEGFDLGVGMHMLASTRRNDDRARVMLNTIGPVWDGNEVWLHHRRRRHVRGVPVLVRLAVLDPLRAARAGAARR